MVQGDIVALAAGTYKCSEGTCADYNTMVYLKDLHGRIACVDDYAGICVLDGENFRTGMILTGTATQ
ncbi:hypothetical protein TrRE_jg2092 [Triparma retinervis]|uniref:Uncharacterized protein n=1 Tax=Triparma retinervis TaxID=2557542 RepID=A0A9W7EB19_9STRA|nr:hypothetical protein TrRE_jg2092 [Triparma retinervis]